MKTLFQEIKADFCFFCQNPELFLIPVAVAMCILVVFSSCASTKLYNQQGQRIAAFQGDMTGVEYTMAADGSVRWRSATVDHSSATKAGGEASQNRIQSAGTAVAASGLTLLLK